MKSFIYLPGKKFGKLTLLKRMKINNHTFFLLKCECGNFIKIRDDKLKNRKRKSCGCEVKTRKRIKGIFLSMIARTENPKVACYKNYGGRGIKICEIWKKSFENFYNWALLNGYKDNLTIDRIDNDGDYCPKNCRWITHKEQQRSKRNNRLVTYKGKTMCVAAWADCFNMKSALIISRLNKGYTEEEAFTFPLHVRRKKKNNVDKRI